jgi:hypothetical protein
VTRQTDQPRPAGDPNPFEEFILGVCVLQGCSVLAGAVPPTMGTALEPGLLLVWAALMILGGVLSIAGLYWPGDPITGVEVKRVGFVAAGTASLTYGVALALAGPQAFVAAFLSLAFALACARRFIQVTRKIKGQRRRIVAARDTEGGDPQ